MSETWDELESLRAELHALDPAWAERQTQLAAEIALLKPILEQLNRYEQDLAPIAALEQVQARLLGGAGVLQRTAAAFGLERLAMLAWPAVADPRPELSAAAGEYRVEVWLYLGTDGRPRVRVVGSRRMEAVLPAPVEKFRAVLLGAVRAPAFTPLPDPAKTSSPAETASPPTAAGTEGTGAEPERPEPALPS